MNEDYKIRPSQIIEISLIVYLILVAFSLPWVKSIYEEVFRREISMMVLGYLGLLIVVTFILFVSIPRRTFSIKNNMTIRKRKFFNRSTTSYNFFKKDEIIIKRVDSRIRNFFYESRFVVINKRGKKIFNIVLNKSDALKLNDEINGVYDKEKTMYERDKDFVFSSRNVLETFIAPSKWFFFIFMINTILIDVFNLYSEYILEGRYPLISSLIILALYLIALLSHFIHTSNTTLKINNNIYKLQRGRIERENITFPASTLKSFTIKYSFFGRHFGIYDIDYIKNHKSILRFPISALNFNVIGRGYDRFKKVKPDKYYFSFILKIIILTGLSVWCMFFRLYTGILLELLSIYYSILSLNSWINYSEESIIIRTHLFSTKFYVLPKKEIQMVKMVRLPFNHTYIKFIGQNLSKGVILNKENTNIVKTTLGYYK